MSHKYTNTKSIASKQAFKLQTTNFPEIIWVKIINLLDKRSLRNFLTTCKVVNYKLNYYLPYTDYLPNILSTLIKKNNVEKYLEIIFNTPYFTFNHLELAIEYNAPGIFTIIYDKFSLTRDQKGQLIHHAIKNNNLRILEVLTKKIGQQCILSNTFEYIDNPLIAVHILNHHRCVGELNPLEISCLYGKTDLIKILLNYYNPTDNDSYSFHVVKLYNRADIFELLSAELFKNNCFENL